MHGEIPPFWLRGHNFDVVTRSDCSPKRLQQGRGGEQDAVAGLSPYCPGGVMACKPT